MKTKVVLYFKRRRGKTRYTRAVPTGGWEWKSSSHSRRPHIPSLLPPRRGHAWHGAARRDNVGGTPKGMWGEIPGESGLLQPLFFLSRVLEGGCWDAGGEVRGTSPREGVGGVSPWVFPVPGVKRGGSATRSPRFGGMGLRNFQHISKRNEKSRWDGAGGGSRKVSDPAGLVQVSGL